LKIAYATGEKIENETGKQSGLHLGEVSGSAMGSSEPWSEEVQRSGGRLIRYENVKERTQFKSAGRA